MFKYATFLDKYNERDLAEEFYLRSLEADPYHSNCLCVYADFLAYGKKLLDSGLSLMDLPSAENLYTCAIKSDQNNPYLLNNYGCLLTKTKKYEKAEECFKSALECNKNDLPAILRNYSIFLTMVGRDEEADDYWKQYQDTKRHLLSISRSEDLD